MQRRSYAVRVWLDAEELAALDAARARTGESRAGLLRRLARGEAAREASATAASPGASSGQDGGRDGFLDMREAGVASGPSGAPSRVLGRAVKSK